MSGWEILQHLLRLYKGVFRDAAPELDRHGLFRMAPFVLALVQDCGTPSAIAAELGLPRPTVSHILRRLQAAGWVSRHPDPDDLRRYRLTLTEAGQEALQAARSCLGAAMDRYTSRLDASEQVELLRLVRKMLAFETAADATGPVATAEGPSAPNTDPNK